jgi:methylglutamate dehydrogenase subunit D
MAEIRIRARSALDGLARPGRHGKAGGEPGVTIGETTGLSLASVIARKGKAAIVATAARAALGIDLPSTPRRVGNGKVAFLWAGPDQWLAVSLEALNPGEFETQLANLFAGSASVSEQSDGRTVIRVAGPNARDALAKGLPIDLHPRAFRPGDTALTLAAHIGLQIWQIDENPTYEIAVFRGFAGSFWHFLAEAAAEFGYRVAEPG